MSVDDAHNYYAEEVIHAEYADLEMIEHDWEYALSMNYLQYLYCFEELTVKELCNLMK